MNYSKEQIEDITKREKDCLDFLKENGMTPACTVQKVSIGEDMFVDKMVPYLRDTKYSDVVSPIQKDELTQKA